MPSRGYNQTFLNPVSIRVSVSTEVHQMSRRRYFVQIGLLTAALVGCLSAARAQVFTTIDYPGASSTTAFGINDTGLVAGNASNGFVLNSGGVFSPIYVPSSTYTYAYGISATGQVAGVYRYAIGTPVHGFVYSGGTFSTIDVSGADGTEVNGISSNGEYVSGTYITGPSKGPNPYHGFTYHRGGISTFDYPGCRLRTVAVGVNDLGQVVGFCSDSLSGNPRGFLDIWGAFSPINVPGASGSGRDQQ